MPPDSSTSAKIVAPPMHPFRRAVLRGLGILLPPLLTIVIFIWLGDKVAKYLLEPLEQATRYTLVWATSDIRTDLPITNPLDDTSVVGGEVFKETGDGKFVPLVVYKTVQQQSGAVSMPGTAYLIYERYVEYRYLKRYVVIPVFLCIFVLLLYLLGKFLAAGIGKFFWGRFEYLIHRLPLIRNVYSSVKQVTDFMFSEREIEYTRVVAVEYPRKGIWSLAMVTGDSLLDISGAANEPCVSLLVPTSPMPFTGFTITAKKSEVVDLNITIDQAFQFIVSCGVVVPPHQMPSLVQKSSPALAAPAGNGAHAPRDGVATEE